MQPFLSDITSIIDKVNWADKNSEIIFTVGKITAITGTTASVQPLVKMFNRQLGWFDSAVLTGINVLASGGLAYQIKTPINVGDIGVLLIPHREVSGAISSQGITQPDSGDMYNLQHALFLPFALSGLKPLGIEIVSGAETPVNLIGSGSYGASTSGLINDLVQILVTLIQVMNTISVDTLSAVATASVAASAQLMTLITKLSLFKGEQ